MSSMCPLEGWFSTYLSFQHWDFCQPSTALMPRWLPLSEHRLGRGGWRRMSWRFLSTGDFWSVTSQGAGQVPGCAIADAEGGEVRVSACLLAPVLRRKRGCVTLGESEAPSSGQARKGCEQAEACENCPTGKRNGSHKAKWQWQDLCFRKTAEWCG